MSVQRLEKGPRMTQIVIHDKVVYISGQVAFDAPWQSLEAQTRNMLEYIDKHLKTAGTDKSKVLMANIWLSDIRGYDTFNEIWDAWVDPDNTPARATVESRLALPQYIIEMSVIAAKD